MKNVCKHQKKELYDSTRKLMVCEKKGRACKMLVHFGQSGGFCRFSPLYDKAREDEKMKQPKMFKKL